MDDMLDKLNAGFALHQQGQLDLAKALYLEILTLEPQQGEVLSLLATIELQQKNFQTCIDLFDKALAIHPNQAHLLNNKAIALRNLNRIDEAIESYVQAIEIKPDYTDAFYNCANLLRELKRLDEALDLYDQALKFKPDYLEAIKNRGLVLHELGLFDAALASFDLAIKLKPDDAESFNNRGIVLRDQNLLADALESYSRALHIKPDHIGALNNLGLLLQAQKQLNAALEKYDLAIRIDPNRVDLYLNRGTLLRELGLYVDALENYDRALKIQPDYQALHFNKANVLCDLKCHAEAIESYDVALRLDPNNADILYNRGNALLYLNRFDQALDDFKRALQINPNADFLYGVYLHTRLQVCDWHGLENDLSLLNDKIERDELASPPFQMLALSNSPKLQRKVAENYARIKYPINQALSKPLNAYKHEKIRIGYFSADFHNHATAYLMASLFEMHDKSKFESIAFSFGSNETDRMRKRLELAFDRFIDVSEKTDHQIAELARQLEIDIAVDLKGYTQDNRTGIFALRAAPIQISYLGYPGTLGADYIDYLIADTTLIPEEDQAYYSEKIIYLADSYQVNDRKRLVSDRVFNRSELGLPSVGFVFCCFNNSYKITPQQFNLWMHILKQVEGSVLWLIEDNKTAPDHLKKAAQDRGVDANRLIFAPRMPLAEHLGRHKVADLFLDTLPYNAHTTASDALWVGLPVLTCIGHSFAGRVAASLLKAIHLPELIVSTPKAYQALAVKLATHPEELQKIKQKLIDHRLKTPLFDAQLFTRRIEALYERIYRGQAASD